MRGSKRRRVDRQGGEFWELRVFAGRDELTGRERQKSRTFRGSAKEADAALRKLIGEVEAGQHRRGAKTVAELIGDWLILIEREGRSATTLREYRRIVSRIISPAIGSVDVRRLTAHRLDAFYGALMSDHRKPAPLSAASVRQVHAVVRAACKQGVKWGYLAANPGDSASPPIVRRTPEAPPSTAEIRRLIEAAREESPDLASILALAAVTGARRGELLGLRWGDVDWSNSTLLIERSVAVLERGETFEKSTKNHQVRRIALDEYGMDVLRDHYAAMGKRFELLGADLTADCPIFTYCLERPPRPISPDTVSHLVRRLGHRLGIPVHLHSLRHYAATQLVGGGTDVRTVAGRLGHKDPATTLRTYAHVLPQRDREAAAALGDGLRG